MPSIEYKCTGCGKACKRHHNAKNCLSCGGVLVATKPRGSRIAVDHNAMNMLRSGVVHLVKHSACHSDGKFVAWTENGRCHYADDPAVAIHNAAANTKDRQCQG